MNKDELKKYSMDTNQWINAFSNINGIDWGDSHHVIRDYLSKLSILNDNKNETDEKWEEPKDMDWDTYDDDYEDDDARYDGGWDEDDDSDMDWDSGITPPPQVGGWDLNSFTVRRPPTFTPKPSEPKVVRFDDNELDDDYFKRLGVK